MHGFACIDDMTECVYERWCHRGLWSFRWRIDWQHRKTQTIRDPAMCVRARVLRIWGVCKFPAVTGRCAIVEWAVRLIFLSCRSMRVIMNYEMWSERVLWSMLSIIKCRPEQRHTNLKWKVLKRRYAICETHKHAYIKQYTWMCRFHVIRMMPYSEIDRAVRAEIHIWSTDVSVHSDQRS